MTLKRVLLSVLLLFSFHSLAQVTPGLPTLAPASSPDSGAAVEKPSGKRIRRQLNLIVGVEHDEEFLIPNKEIVVRGRTEYFDIKRIVGTDTFRIVPKKTGSGVTTLHDKKTGQMLVEIRFDVRDDAMEKILREVESMLADIEGIEFKIVNNFVYLDGYVLVPRDLVRIAQVIKVWEGKVKSLVTLNPMARKKIAEFISAEVNNPEVKISAIGDYIKLEGQVNSKEEKARINQVVAMYLPDLVVENAPDTENIRIFGRKNSGKIEDLIIDLITIKKDEEKVEPPPKMIQIVTHFVKFSDTYLKEFNFRFAPVISAVTGSQPRNPTSSIQDTASLLGNLLPKLNWAKFHGFAKVLDTASVLVQDKSLAKITRNIKTFTTQAGQNGAVNIIEDPAGEAIVDVSATPTIKSERSGLIELKQLGVSIKTPTKSESTTTTVSTTISVRDRQSAAFGGIIKKSTDTKYGTPLNEQAIITLEANKAYARGNSQFVVFVTPIIKSSASAGVEQVKKKFRLRD